MANEDFTTYTEVDPGADLSQTSARSTFTNLDTRNSNSWLGYDFGAAYFSGDFTHHADIYLSRLDGGDGALAVFWSLTNILDDMGGIYSAAGESGLFVRVWNNAGVRDLAVYEIDGSSAYVSTGFAMSLSTNYFLKIKRVEADSTYGTMYLDVYTSDANRTAEVSAVANLSLALHTSKKDFRYMELMEGWNSGAANILASGYSENLDLSAGVTLQDVVVSMTGGALVGGTATTAMTFNIETTMTGGVVAGGTATTVPLLKNTAGFGASNVALGWPCQSHTMYDGKQIYVASYQGTGALADLQMSYGLASDMLFGQSHVWNTAQATIDDGQNFSMWNEYSQTYRLALGLRLRAGGGGRSSNVAKEDLDETMSSSVIMVGAGYSAGVTDEDDNPGTCVDIDDNRWVSGRVGTSPNWSLGISRGVSPFRASSWETMTTLRTTNANDGIVQPVPDNVGNVLAVYSEDTSGLYAKFSELSTRADTNDWDAEETIDTNLHTFYSFRCVATRNSKFMLVYRDATDNKLYYRLRAAGTGAAWGTDTVINADTALADAFGFTLCGDLGNSESVYLAYYDTSGNIVHRTWNGTSWSAKTTLETAPSQRNYMLDSPYGDSEKMPVVWHEATTDTIKVSLIDFTPTRIESDGTEVILDGDPNLGTYQWNTQMLSYGNKSLVLATNRAQETMARVYNHSTSAWEGTWTVKTLDFWNLHQTASNGFVSGSGICYIIAGGATHGGQANPLTVIRSLYALDHASFTLDAIDWEDVSPPNDTETVYTNIVVDQADVPYLVYTQAGVDADEVAIREYRGGAWSSVTTIVNTILGTGGEPFHVEFHLGKEPTGQKSLHGFFTLKKNDEEPEVTGGSIVNKMLAYLQIIPQGDGTFKIYNAGGTEITKPADEYTWDIVYTGDWTTNPGYGTWAASTPKSVGNRITAGGFLHECIVAGTTGGTEPTWPVNHYGTVVDGSTLTWKNLAVHDTLYKVRIAGGVAVVGPSNRPAIAHAKCDSTSPYNVSSVDFIYWDGTNWVTKQILSGGSNFPWTVSPKMVEGSNGIFVVFERDYGGGVADLSLYKSTDDGITWNAGERLTTASNDVRIPLMSKRTALVQNILWHNKVSRLHSEISFTSAQISTFIATYRSKIAGGMSPMTGGMT